MIETQIRRLSDEERVRGDSECRWRNILRGTVAAATGQLPEDCECLFERLARGARDSPTGTQYLPDGTTSQSYAFVGHCT